MKKFVSLYIALNIMLISVLAAPYDMGYLASARHTLVSIMRTATDTFGDNKVSGAPSSTPSNTDSEKPNIRNIREVAAALAVVDSIMYCTYDGEEMKKMIYYINGGKDKYECYFDSDSYNVGGKHHHNQLNRGSLVYVNLDEKDVVEQYRVIAVMDNGTGLPDVDPNGNPIFNSSKISLKYSYILDYGYGKGILDIDLTDGSSLSVPTDSNMYTIQSEKNNVKIYTDSCTSADVYKAEYRDDTGKTAVYPVISVLYEDESVFTCSYSTQVYIDGNITE